MDQDYEIFAKLLSGSSEFAAQLVAHLTTQLDAREDETSCKSQT